MSSAAELNTVNAYSESELWDAELPTSAESPATVGPGVDEGGAGCGVNGSNGSGTGGGAACGAAGCGFNGAHVCGAAGGGGEVGGGGTVGSGGTVGGAGGSGGVDSKRGGGDGCARNPATPNSHGTEAPKPPARMHSGLWLTMYLKVSTLLIGVKAPGGFLSK